MTDASPNACPDCNRPKREVYTSAHAVDACPLEHFSGTRPNGEAYDTRRTCLAIALDRARTVADAALARRRAIHAEEEAFNRLLGVVGEERKALRVAWDVASEVTVEASRRLEAALDAYDGKAAP